MSSAVSDTTASPAPFSPFSTYSSTSGVTSDGARPPRSVSHMEVSEPDLLPPYLFRSIQHLGTPDLGEFTTVFREFGNFRRGRTNGSRYSEDATTPTSFALSPSDDDDSEEVRNGQPTVWDHDSIAPYLSSSPESPPPPSPSPPDSDSIHNSEGDDLPVDYDSVEINAEVADQPSLGLLGALEFLAAERARLAAARGDAVGQRGNSSTTSDGTWQHALAMSPRRKRRRKRNKSERRPDPEESPTVATNGDADDTAGNVTASQDDADDSSSSIDPSSPQYYKSVPPSPPPQQQESSRRNQRSTVQTTNDTTLRIHHSKSTPTLRLPMTMPMDARVLQLRNLAHKLRMLFPQEAASLADVLSNDNPNSSDLSDPRGPIPRSHDTLVHVFIDHSNILFGFLTYLKRHFRKSERKPRHMSHAALALILERGRPITRRVMVTSSPLYQPVDSAEQLGYEVNILRRVPDTGDGQDRQPSSSSGNEQQARNIIAQPSSITQPMYVRTPGSSRKTLQGRGHAHKISGGSAGIGSSNTESDPSSVNGRVRYREQGVDELLQLKLHQAIADADVVPRNATIILATGDGNVGQFNEDGFLGCVKTALKKGWKVELYSWEGGLSKAWMREFGENERFKIYPLDRFAIDMLEIP